MYAILQYSAGNSGSATQYGIGNVIRDIVRLCTSPSPNINYLVAFSNTTSSIVDATPAGWSLVYGNNDGTTLPAANTDPNAARLDSTGASGVGYWAISAPCLGPQANTVKYAKLSVNMGTGSTNFQDSVVVGIQLTSAVSISNTGTIVGENYRPYWTAYSTTSQDQSILNTSSLGGNGTYHLIATQRHITIIKEGVGYYGLWEHTISDYHKAYNITPVVTVLSKGTGYGTTDSLGNHPNFRRVTGPITPRNLSSSGEGQDSSTINNHRFIFNITDINNTTSYSNLSLGIPWLQPYLHAVPPGIGANSVNSMRTVSSNGLTRNIVQPIMFNHHQFGVPTCFVTDICDIYMCQSGIGSTGDTININGVNYTYFDCGTGSGTSIRPALVIGTFSS